jgi:hypothetical protein
VSLRRLLLVCSLALLATPIARAPLAAQDNDIIRGRVMGPDKKPLENVTVTATSLVDQTSRSTKTGKDGRFSIIFSGGGGDYMMAFTAIGYQPNRFEVKREVDEDILIADASLSKTAVTLEAVRVTAGRERPGREGNQLDAGSREALHQLVETRLVVDGDQGAPDRDAVVHQITPAVARAPRRSMLGDVTPRWLPTRASRVRSP